MIGPEADRKAFDDRKVMWLTELELGGKLTKQTNWRVITAPDARVQEPADPDSRTWERLSRIACGAWHAHRDVDPT